MLADDVVGESCCSDCVCIIGCLLLPSVTTGDVVVVIALFINAGSDDDDVSTNGF